MNETDIRRARKIAKQKAREKTNPKPKYSSALDKKENQRKL
jgi:hypothetical protein